MSKKTRFIAAVISILVGTFVALPGAPNPVQAQTPTSGIYKITQVETETTPIGCVGCMPTKSFVPTFEAQTSVNAAVAAASEIDTFSTSAWDQASNTQKSFVGGCAVVSGGLKCWGDNSRGQLGDETTTSSLEVPVTAKENGVALAGITDVSTNGLTTCVVDDGALKCVGAGNWQGNSSKRYTFSEYVRTYSADRSTYSDAPWTSRYILNVYNSSSSLIYTKEDTNWIPDTLVSKTWVPITSLGSSVKKVQVGANTGSTPTICALLTDGTAKCAKVTAGETSNTSDNLTTSGYESDCDGLTTAEGIKYEKAGDVCTVGELGGRTQYATRYKSGSLQLTTAATWAWIDAEVTSAVDIAMPADTWGASNVCFAGPTTICRTFSGGEFGKASTIENGDNSQAVYMTQGFGPPGLCLYSNDTISCGAGSYPAGGGGPLMATKVTAVAVMAKPLNIFFGTSGTMQKLYFLLPSGLLSADGWIFTCTTCGSSSTTNVVTPVTAFSASSATSYTYAQSVNGATDSADFIPLTVVSGTRKTRSSVQMTVKTASGEALTGVTVKWTAPDAPGLLSSSATSTLATDASGNARSTLPSGPVTFSLAPPALSPSTPGYVGPTYPGMPTTTTTVPASSGTTGGRLASGATLQAASITVIVGETGTVTITVPDPPAVVQRKISVLLPDSTPVPGATVNLKNTYLTYAYQNSAGSTSSWSSRPRDTKGYMGQMSCAYCFVAPPRYATGSDGSVTFPSFNPSVRSSAYDADIAYDDGELNQIVKKSFTSTTETVSMPFMASIKATLPDADPTTPAKDADLDPSTPEPDVKPDSNGAVTIESSLVDEDNAPISKFTQIAETVNEGCDKGGLVGSTAKADSVCIEGIVSTSSLGRVAGVRSAGARASATCNAVTTAETNSAGKASLVLCPTVSTKYRIRGKGAIASKTFCVVVNGQKCGTGSAVPVSGPSTGTPSTYTTPKTTSTPATKVISVKKGARIAATKYLKAAKGTTATYKVTSGKCKIAKTLITTPKTSGFCTITMTQTAKKIVKGKVTLVRTKKSVRLKVG